MRFRLAVTVAIATAALVSAGCSSSPSAPKSAAATSSIQSFTIGTTFPENNIDPTKGYGSTISSLSLEKLTEISPSGAIEPYLASSVTHPSPLTYVYQLRHGIRFWDGSPLTSADAAYSLNYERAAASQESSLFTSVKSITASGPYTLTITLSHPDPSLAYAVASSGYIFEKKFAQEHAGKFGNPGVLIMGTGPWEVRSLDPTTGAQLTANPHWWRGTVPIQNISFKFFANDTSAALAFRAGEIDMDPFIDGPKSFAASSGARIWAAPTDCTNALFSMNTSVAPWNDVHVRRAIAYALNRQDIIQAEGGYAQPYTTFIPVKMLQHIATGAQISALLKSLPRYPYSLARARQELARSRYPHVFTAPVTVFIYGNVVSTAEAIAGELQKVGINMQVKPVTLAAWGTDLSGPLAKRPASYFTTGCNTPDASGYDWLIGQANLAPGQYNAAVWDPPESDQLISQGLTASTSAGRFAAYSKLLRLIATDVPYIPLFLHDYSIALSSKYKFAGYNQFSINDSLPYALSIRPASP
ncbi:MAG TPA: ABC transporter substrate-binding protein [Streptosporangiaceae bacterium]|nr:ABC transporter substrate-binding protein [Streptosporangiaceae bacterium]